MKRIAMISYHTCPLASEEGKETGGMNVYVLELSRELAAMGHDVDMFTRSQDIHNTYVVEIAPRLRLVHLVAGPQAPVSKKEIRPYIPQFIANYHAFCREHAVAHDVIHAHYYLSGLIGLQLQSEKKEKKLPLVLSFHTLALMKNLVARDIGEKEDTGRIDAEMLLVKQAHHIIAASESDKSYLRYLYDASENLVSAIPPGVNTQLFKPMDMNEAKKHIGISEQDKMILFVGRIEPLKGIDMLMYAMKIVTQRNPRLPVCLCIVGGDVSQPKSSWTRTLRSLDAVRQVLHMSTTVNFVGRQKQETLPYFYNACEMVVMPSHYESFGIAALEAMSCGVPVITTNVAGVSSLIDEKHSSLVTSVNNPLLLATQIEALLHHPEKRQEMGCDIRKNVLDLSWKNIARRVSSVYDNLSV